MSGKPILTVTGEPGRRVYFGPEEPLRQYFGEDESMVIMEEGAWVEEHYGGGSL